MKGDDAEMWIGASGTRVVRDADNSAHDVIVDIGTPSNGDALARHTALLDALPQQLAAQAQQRRLRSRQQPSRAKHSHHANTTPPTWTQADTASPMQQLGVQVEDRVCQYLQTQGARILIRNVQSKHGEIDIVCVDADVLAFVEVRHRASSRYGGAAASVGPRKQARLIRTAQVWLPRLIACYFDGQVPPCRFDVVAVQQGRMEWFKQAFRIADCASMGTAS